MSKTISGPSVVVVEVVDGSGKRHALPLKRGDEVPKNLADGELDKLEELGAFLSSDEHRQSMIVGSTTTVLAEPDLPAAVIAGGVSAEVAHNTAPEGEPVQPASEPAPVQTVAPDAEPKPVAKPARKRAAKKAAALKK